MTNNALTRQLLRQADFNFLMSEEAQEIIKDEGIIIIDYQPLQEFWRKN